MRVGQRLQLVLVVFERLMIGRFPDLDFVALARGMGVPGRAVANVDDFVKALAEAVAEPGPRLIEVQM